MKKIFCIILIVFFIAPVYSSVNDSNNSFEIVLTQVPSGSGGTKSRSGLSDGAVTAITLGSVFGGIGALGGIGYYFFKHNKCLTCGFACGETSPYQIVSLENSDFITKSKHTYLIKAYNQINKEDIPLAKYLIIPDTTIAPNTYNTVYFELPYENKETKFKIIQASAPLAGYKHLPELDTDIFINPKSVSVQKVPSSGINVDNNFGIVIKQGTIPPQQNRLFAINTYYKASDKFAREKIYAIIVMFEE